MEFSCFMQMTLDTLRGLLKPGGQNRHGRPARRVFISPHPDLRPLPEKPAWRKLFRSPQTAAIATRRGRVFGRCDGSVNLMRKNKAKRDESNDLD